jgi:DNA-binding FadR family transcriptional regulator
MAVVVGAMEDVWSSHVREGLTAVRDRGLSPDPAMSRAVVDDHARLNDLIAAGDVRAAVDAARAHLHNEPRIHAQSAAITDQNVRAGVVRDHLYRR